MTRWCTEWWICSECCAVAEAREWGGDDSTAICPGCGFEHHDDESSAVYAEPTEIAAQRKRRELLAWAST